MGILDKLKNSASRAPPPSQQSYPPPPAPHFLSPQDVYRYRHQRGVNLGSWFVLERWMASKPFEGAVAPGQSDLDVARGKNAKANLEAHWDSWVGDDDWRWIKKHGYNSVRLPIGFHHLCGPCPDVLRGTDFEPFHDTFSGAWNRIVNAIRTAEKYGIGVLIDLHAVAGGQNNDAHCGNSSGKPKLFSSSTNLNSTALALRFLASFLAPIPHVVGLQLLNEPANNNRIQGWYESTIADLRNICGHDFPLYVHDAWDTPWYAPWAGRRGDWTVVDHHLYRTFTPEDNCLNGDQHAGKLRDHFAGTLQHQSDQANGQLVVAEFSATINPQSIGHMPAGEQDRQRRVFVRAEVELFNKSTAGWWFWTYKLEEPWNAGWSARNATQAEILPKFVGVKFRGAPQAGTKEQMLRQAHATHIQYWQSHGGSPNPASFAPGFSQGWDDALLFLQHPSGPSVLGFTHQWIIRRRGEFESRHGPLGQGWEWDEGFRQGLRGCVGVCME